jgi:hypothetical protein
VIFMFFQFWKCVIWTQTSIRKINQPEREIHRIRENPIWRQLDATQNGRAEITCARDFHQIPIFGDIEILAYFDGLGVGTCLTANDILREAENLIFRNLNFCTKIDTLAMRLVKTMSEA